MNVYFDVDDILFLVATGSGEKMTVERYEGIDEFKEAVGMGNHGVFKLENAVFSVVDTLTDAKFANVCFVFDDSYSADMRYVFVPYTLDENDWREATGDALGMEHAYTGAYYEGREITIYFDDEDLENGMTLAGGFYTYTRTKDGDYVPSVDRLPQWQWR